MRIGSLAVFILVYVLFMIPTYVLPYFGSNSYVAGAVGLAAGAGINPLLWVHLLALLVLVAVTWGRAAFIDKKWVVVFPVLATIFDLAPVLNIIPLVPTVMHILALVLGSIDKRPQE